MLHPYTVTASSTWVSKQGSLFSTEADEMTFEDDDDFYEDDDTERTCDTSTGCKTAVLVSATLETILPICSNSSWLCLGT